MDTVFPRIIAGGDYFYSPTKTGRLFAGRQLFEGGDYFKYISQEALPYTHFVLLHQAITEKSEINERYHRKAVKKPGAFVTIQL